MYVCMCRYKIGELGPSACPAGRLLEGLPSYTGNGGGGSGTVVSRADGSPLVAFPTPDNANNNNNIIGETKKSA